MSPFATWPKNTPAGRVDWLWPKWPRDSSSAPGPNTPTWVRRLGKGRPFRFSRAALETLAIVAYRQPVTRAEIEYLRGVDSGGVLKTLLDKRLVKILGKKDVPGRPMIYGTSREFLELFTLRSLGGTAHSQGIQ